MPVYEVLAHWDPDAHVWWAESNDVPGLVAEAKTHEVMMTELRLLVPELLAENGKMPPDGQIRLHVVMDEFADLRLG